MYIHFKSDMVTILDLKKNHAILQTLDITVISTKTN